MYPWALRKVGCRGEGGVSEFVQSGMIEKELLVIMTLSISKTGETLPSAACYSEV